MDDSERFRERIKKILGEMEELDVADWNEVQQFHHLMEALGVNLCDFHNIHISAYSMNPMVDALETLSKRLKDQKIGEAADFSLLITNNLHGMEYDESGDDPSIGDEIVQFKIDLMEILNDKIECLIESSTSS